MYSTEGIVLKRIDAGEADCLFSIYTKEYGKIRARAQGIRKESAKLKGHLEPLSQSHVSFVLGKSGERLTHAVLMKFFPEIRQDSQRYAAAHYMLELIDEQCFAGEKDEAMWNCLTIFLEKLNSVALPANRDAPANVFRKKTLAALLVEFEIRFLDCLGYNGEKDMRVLETRVSNPLYHYV